jgi:hypothetical protein
MTLTDTQLLLLSAASQREDLLLVPPGNLKGKVASAATSKLLRSHLVEEVVVRRDEPHWREDEEHCIGLRLTPAGLQAIGIVSDEQSGDQQPTEQAQARNAPAPSAGMPREGSKKALVIALLSRDKGATLDDLVAATGWLPHTTRAALSGLRKGGHPITGDRNEAGKTVYRLKPQEGETSAHDAA